MVIAKKNYEKKIDLLLVYVSLHGELLMLIVDKSQTC